jgi:enoyl-CoA hydratase
MDDLLTYELSERIATVTLDDGKANVMSIRMLQALDGALARAQADQAAVVLTGRPGMFSGGFDLNVFKQGNAQQQYQMLEAGARITEKLLSFPLPVVAACTGHAIAMGVFLLLSTDVRLGADLPGARIQVNEVQIGLTLPRFAIEVCRQRLAPSHLSVAAVTALPYAPAQALAAGFFDELVAPEALAASARASAARLLQLHAQAFAATKLRLRKATLEALHLAIREDTADWASRFGVSG